MSENARYDEGYREGLRDGIELSKDCEGVIAERYERIGRDKGYAAGESELSALRAEVETLRRALEWVLRKTVDSMDCPPEFRGDVICDGPSNSECVKCVMKWAISEARKGDEG